MKLYKYRSLHRMDFISEILIDGNVYCAKYSELNDPFEGQFRKFYNPVQFGDTIFGSDQFSENTHKVESLADYNNLFKKRICSFSKSATDVRMWSYYADSHTGICFEFEVDDLHNNSNFHEVIYKKDLKKVLSDKITDSIAINILKHKTHQWKFEKEVRLITDKHSYNMKSQLKCIILGCRISSINKKIIEPLSKLLAFHQRTCYLPI